MKYSTEMGSVAMTYVLSLINIGSGIQKLIHTSAHTPTHEHTHTHTPLYLISPLLFFSEQRK